MPREMLIGRVYDHFQSDDEFKLPSKAAAGRLLEKFEAVIRDVISQHTVRLFGGTFKLSEVSQRIYAPNEVLERVYTPYHTVVNAHVQSKFSIKFGSTKTRGTMGDDGVTFFEGQFDDQGNFTQGTWAINEVTAEDGTVTSEEVFTPAE